jgi:DNA mismatch endonuclease (patch repair protein)
MKETPEALRSRTMRAVKSKDTEPEWIVRKLLHAAGYRYRLHAKELPGKPDLVFPSRRKVVFVHGCFWHGHACARGARRPKTNSEYWKGKIARNRERDEAHLIALRQGGWKVRTIWECEINRGVLPGLKRFLGPAQRPNS